MKYETGDLVRVCWRKSQPDEEVWALDGTAGIVISRRMVEGWRSLPDEAVYRVYLANLECREILEDDLEIL